MSTAADLTVEILKQIRDGVLEVRAEVSGLRNQVTYIHQEQIQTNARLDRTNESLETLRSDMTGELASLHKTVHRIGRINDETLKFSLEDSGRIEVLEGRVGTLESQMGTLRARR